MKDISNPDIKSNKEIMMSIVKAVSPKKRARKITTRNKSKEETSKNDTDKSNDKKSTSK